LARRAKKDGVPEIENAVVHPPNRQPDEEMGSARRLAGKNV
jgi:hypothetical protein